MPIFPRPSDPPTRQRVLHLLRQGPATVEELALAVGLTPNAVRVHLASLERDGEVRREGVRHAETAGKPPQVYRATAAAEERLSRGYPLALAALAEALAARLPAARARTLFTLAGRKAAASLPAASRGDVVDRARRLLESLGAIATVEKVRGRPARISGSSCPLAAAVRRNPETCELVRSMLAEATGAQVATCCEHGAAPKCRFTIAVP